MRFSIQKLTSVYLSIRPSFTPSGPTETLYRTGPLSKRASSLHPLRLRALLRSASSSPYVPPPPSPLLRLLLPSQ